MTSYFKIFECGGKIFNIIDVAYEQACMAITKDKYYTKMLEMLVDCNDRKNKLLSNGNIRQSVSIVIAEM